MSEGGPSREISHVRVTELTRKHNKWYRRLIRFLRMKVPKRKGKPKAEIPTQGSPGTPNPDLKEARQS